MPALVNGSPAGQLPLQDRGFLYGDGLFETVRFSGSRVPLWSYHRARLEKGLARLAIDCNIADIESDLRTLLSGVGEQQGVLRITVTRGDGQGGYAVPDAPARRVLESRTLPARTGQDGVTLRLCDWRLPQQPALAGIKHLNRLDQVMARHEWDDSTIFDGLMCDTSGAVIETTSCNLFIRSGEQWLTPDMSQAGVAGVMRAWLLSEGLPAIGHDAGVCELTLTQLVHADEVFICNSVRGILPVTNLVHPRACWPAGRMTQQLQCAVEELWHA